MFHTEVFLLNKVSVFYAEMTFINWLFLFKDIFVIQGCQGWPQIRSDCPQMGPILDFFMSDFSFQFILARQAKMYWNLIWKCPDLSYLGANLIHFGTKPDIPDVMIK